MTDIEIDWICKQVENERNDNCKAKQDLIDVICNSFYLTKDELFNRSRKREIIDGRRFYLYVLNKKLKWGPVKVSRYTAKISGHQGWDHATILTSCKKYKTLIETEKAYREKTAQIISGIENESIQLPIYDLVI